MSEVQRQFEERIRRAVSKFLRHAEGEGLDARELDGAVVLKFESGQLTGVEYSPAAKLPQTTISGPVSRRRATTAEVRAEIAAAEAEGQSVELDDLWPAEGVDTGDDGHG